VTFSRQPLARRAFFSPQQRPRERRRPTPPTTLTSPLPLQKKKKSTHTTGKDATEDFDEIGHSNAAKEQLEQFYIGDFEGGDISAPSRSRAGTAVKAGGAGGGAGASPAVRALQMLLPILAVLAAVLLPKLLSK
jgi:hypothetical protein